MNSSHLPSRLLSLFFSFIFILMHFRTSLVFFIFWKCSQQQYENEEDTNRLRKVPRRKEENKEEREITIGTAWKSFISLTFPGEQFPYESLNVL